MVFLQRGEIKTKLGFKATAFLRGVYKNKRNLLNYQSWTESFRHERHTDTVYKLESNKEVKFATRFSNASRGLWESGIHYTIYVDDGFFRIDFGYNMLIRSLTIYLRRI